MAEVDEVGEVGEDDEASAQGTDAGAEEVEVVGQADGGAVHGAEVRGVFTWRASR